MLIEAVRAGGLLALQAFRSQQKSWLKDGDSPVSESDMAVNALLHDRLRQHTPGYGWLSEESADEPARLAAERVWVVDPIDGTRSYLAGSPDWCVSVALVAGGRPVLAALYAPVADQMFVALAGGGAALNGRELAVPDSGSISRSRLAGPRGTLERLARHIPDVESLPRIGSLALRLARVAEGTVDIAFASGRSHDWDLAAADLLVHEAGGMMTTLAGEQVIYNRPSPVHEPLVAAARQRHAAMLALIRGDPAAFQ